MNIEAPSPVRILLVDDEPSVLETIGDFLRHEGYAVTPVDGGGPALEKLKKSEFDIIITDLSMPGVDGFAIMKEAQMLQPDTPVIVLTGRGTLENAILAIKHGAYDFLTKPLPSLQVLQINIERALEKRYLRLSQKAYLVQIERQNKALLQDLDAARRIQESIIQHGFGKANHCLNITTRYLPAEKVGGDFFDIFFLAPHFVVFYLADVAGHGVSSAMVTVFAKQALNAISETISTDGSVSGPSPRDILVQFNREMLNQGFQMDGTPLYLTVFLGVYDASRRMVRYSNGGHHPLPRYLNQAGRLSHIDLTGNPVGLFDHPLFEEGAIEVDVGESLFLCTDGVVEAQGPGLAPFGTDQMDAYLLQNRKTASEEVADGLIERVRGHLGTSLQPDDIAILILSPKACGAPWENRVT